MCCPNCIPLLLYTRVLQTVPSPPAHSCAPNCTLPSCTPVFSKLYPSLLHTRVLQTVPSPPAHPCSPNCTFLSCTHVFSKLYPPPAHPCSPNCTFPSCTPVFSKLYASCPAHLCFYRIGGVQLENGYADEDGYGWENTMCKKGEPTLKMNVQDPSLQLDEITKILGESITSKPKVKKAIDDVRETIKKVEDGLVTYGDIRKCLNSLSKEVKDGGGAATKLQQFKSLTKKMEEGLSKWVTSVEKRRENKVQKQPDGSQASLNRKTAPVSPSPQTQKLGDRSKPRDSTSSQTTAGSTMAVVGSSAKLSGETQPLEVFTERCIVVLKKHGIIKSEMKPTPTPRQGRQPKETKALPKKSKEEILSSGIDGLDERLSELTKIEGEFSKQSEKIKSLSSECKLLTELKDGLQNLVNKYNPSKPPVTGKGPNQTKLQPKSKETTQVSLSGLCSSLQEGIASIAQEMELLPGLKKSQEDLEKRTKELEKELFLNSTENQNLVEMMKSLQLLVDKYIPKHPAKGKGKANEPRPKEKTISDTCSSLQQQMKSIDQQLGDLPRLEQEIKASIEIIQDLEQLAEKHKLPASKVKTKKSTNNHRCIVDEQQAVVGEIEFLETKLQELHDQIDSLSRENQDLQQKLKNEEKKLEDLQEANERMHNLKDIGSKAERKKKDKEAEKKEKSLEGKLTNKETEYQSVLVENKDLKRKLEGIEEKLAMRERECQTALEDKDALQKAFGGTETRQEKTDQDTWSELQKEISRVRRDQKELDGIIGREKVKQLHDNISHAQGRPQSAGEPNMRADKIKNALQQVCEEVGELLKRARNMEIGVDKEMEKNIQRQNEQVREAKDSLKRFDELQHRLQQISTEKEYWVNRYSQLAGAKLYDNNPGVADLSDLDRPSKLAERMSELYDNEWTESFETLCKRKKLSERESIDRLLETLKKSFKFCKDVSEDQLEDVQKILFYTELQGKHGTKRDIEKGLSRERFVNDFKDEFQFELQYCRQYIEMCLEVCWLMCVQDPPVVLEWTAVKSDNFDRNLFRAYTKSGNKFDFVVWPAILLHKGGAILSKGIAQPL
ncbi:hypothetical protein ScPMuIL_010868 [Solemya velum]